MSASHVRKSLLSLNSWNYGGGSPAIPHPPTSCSKERSNSNASCRTTGSSSALALATSNMVDFWNRVSQQMAYIDGSTRSPSLIGDGGSCGTRSSLPTDLSGNGTKDVVLAAAPGNNHSLSLLDDDRILGSTMASINSRSVSLLDGAADSIPEEEDDAQDEEDASPPLLPLPPASEALLPQKVLPQKMTSPASLSGSGRYTATTCSPETAALTYASPPQRKHSKPLLRQANVTSSEDVSGDDMPEVMDEKEQKGNGWRGTSVRPWYRRTASLSSARNFRQHTMKNDEEDTQSAIWHHVFSEAPQDRMNNNSSNRKGTFYRNLFNDDDDDECFLDDGGVGIMELELLQPATINLCNAGKIYKCGSRISGVMPNSASVVLETASMGGSRVTTRTRLHRYQQQFGFHGAGGRRLSQPFDMVFYYHAGVGTKKASSWEESEAVQRRRSVMLAAAVVGTATGPGYPITTSCPGTAGLLMLHPTSSELQLLDKRDLRYYFQHPYPRLFVSYFVIFCNFLLFAEDPISHSHTESDIPMVGNVFSFVLTKYPPEWRWSLIKVLMWLLAMLIGMILGKLLIHGYVCGKLLRLKMFRDDQGSWMTMFLTVIVSLYVFSHAYNLLLVLWYDDSHYQINSQMGVTNASVMKAAACGTWLGDLITALMVTDMMLQDNLYPHWASWFRQLWRRSNVPRILIFWVGSVVATSVVVTLIVSDWISWDKLNRDFVATTELSRAFLASFILVMDLLIVMQDWDFPHFTTTLHVNLPGFSVATLNWKYAEVDITGKWFNYGIIVMVMLLDLNMWKNQIFYNPKDFGQYTGPDDKIRTVNDPEILAAGNISYWTWESRTRINPETNLPYYEEDMQMNSRFMSYPLSVKWTAFIPSVIGLVLFVSLVSLYGRFPAHQPHGVKRNQSPCRGAQGKQEGNSR